MKGVISTWVALLALTTVYAAPSRHRRKPTAPRRAPVNSRATVVVFSQPNRIAPPNEQPHFPFSGQAPLIDTPRVLTPTAAIPSAPLDLISIHAAPLVQAKGHLDKGKGVAASNGRTKEAVTPSPRLSDSLLDQLDASSDVYSPSGSKNVLPSSLTLSVLPQLATTSNDKKSLTAFQRRRALNEMWKELNIDFQDPPSPADLVQTVKSINIDRLSRLSIGQFAAYKIRKATSKEYMDEYLFRNDQFNSAKSYEMVKQKTAMLAELGNSSRGRRRRRQSDEGAPQKMHSRMQRTQERHDRIIKALTEKEVWSLPADKLEEATREFTFEDHRPKHLTRIMTTHLKKLGREQDAKDFLGLKDLHRRQSKYKSMTETERHEQRLKKGKRQGTE